ncbi:alpha/beta hydrolase [Hasllibacter sp. MH4015]|uniref:alpha/beta hydrolase n=1 Tax=Hasllibacter sp. MH4015 TaxID=2854029 RepID=UPI001CD42D5B|nr:alpha/beta fold hydrolase [Hasllibacter sp. MH4015]
MTRLTLTRRHLLAGAAAYPLSACGLTPDVLIRPEAAGLGASETVFVASNRVFEDGRFSAARQDRLGYTRFTINIPPNREVGAVQPGRSAGRGPDPMSEFVATAGDHLGARSTFRATLLAEAERTGTREVMIFIHGFNTTLGTGLYRTAQIRHDFDIPGIPVHYAWPSAGNPLGYAYDRDSSLFARDGLEELVREITAAGLGVVLIAHSIGSAIVMEVLRQLRIAGSADVLGHINGVILFSPDIDVDVFRAQAARIGELPQPFVIFTSQRDRALTLSARITGLRERVGNLSNADDVADFEVTLIDTSAFAGGVRDPLNHFAGASSPAVVELLRDIAQVNNAFESDRSQQAGLLPGTILTIQNATQVLLSPIDN